MVEAPFRRAHWTMLLLAVAAAAALRLVNLGTWSLWIDEAHTWRDATMPWEGLDSDRKLYALTFLLLRGLLSRELIAGDEFSLRLPFVVVGILTVPLMALCGRRLVGAWPAVLAAWLLALNPWHVYWSQNARGYVLVAAVAAVTANRAHSWIVTQRTRDFFALLLSIGLATLCHPAGGMQAAGVAAFLILRRSRAPHGRVLVRILLAVSVVVVVVPFVVDWLPFQGFFRSKAEKSLLHLVQTLAYYFVPVVLLTGGVGVLLGWRYLGRDRSMLLACLWLVPFAVLLAIGGTVAKMTARYAICTLPALTWLVAFGCVRVAAVVSRERDRMPTGRLVAAALLPVLLFVEYGRQAVAYHTDQYGDRARWKEACSFALAKAGDHPLRVLTVNQPTVLYYLRPEHWSSGLQNLYPGIQVVPLIDWMVQEGVNENKQRVCEPGAQNHLRWHIAEAQKVKGQFVVMLTLPELREADVDGAIERTLQVEFDLALHLPCWVGPKDESVYVFVPKGI